MSDIATSLLNEVIGSLVEADVFSVVGTDEGTVIQNNSFNPDRPSPATELSILLGIQTVVGEFYGNEQIAQRNNYGSGLLIKGIDVESFIDAVSSDAFKARFESYLETSFDPSKLEEEANETVMLLLQKIADRNAPPIDKILAGGKPINSGITEESIDVTIEPGYGTVRVILDEQTISQLVRDEATQILVDIYERSTNEVGVSSSLIRQKGQDGWIGFMAVIEQKESYSPALILREMISQINSHIGREGHSR